MGWSYGSPNEPFKYLSFSAIQRNMLENKERQRQRFDHMSFNWVIQDWLSMYANQNQCHLYMTCFHTVYLLTLTTLAIFDMYISYTNIGLLQVSQVLLLFPKLSGYVLQLNTVLKSKAQLLLWFWILCNLINSNELDVGNINL